jgi:hypothetical protein
VVRDLHPRLPLTVAGVVGVVLPALVLQGALADFPVVGELLQRDAALVGAVIDPERVKDLLVRATSGVAVDEILAVIAAAEREAVAGMADGAAPADGGELLG